MMEERKGRVSYVIGPDGSPLTLADLPPPSTRRWVIRRKAEVVAAVRGGLLSLDEACRRYTLTVEEFLAWQHAIDRFGLAGLRAIGLPRQVADRNIHALNTLDLSVVVHARGLADAPPTSAAPLQRRNIRIADLL